MITYGRSIYYPSIEFRNLTWFKFSTLFYEGLDRIVPKGLPVNDPDEVKRFNDEIGYIKNINPKKYSDPASEKYLEYLKNNILCLPDDKLQEVLSMKNENQFDIHHDKLGYKLIDQLKEIDAITNNEDWYNFPHILGVTYMAYLANEIGTQKDLPVVTDYAKNLMPLNTTQVDSKITNEDIAFNLASIAFKSYLPKNVEQVSIDQLLDFRKNHEAERIRFYSAVNDLVADLKQITSKDSLDDILKFRQKEIDAAVNALRLSLKGLGIEVYEGLLGISLPAALQLLPAEDEFSSFIKNFGTASIFCALGAKSYIGRRKIKHNSPYSYLLSLEKSNLGKELLHKQLLKGKIII